MESSKMTTERSTFTVHDDAMGIHMPRGATFITSPVRSFDHDGVYIVQWRGKPMVPRVEEGVHPQQPDLLLMTFDGRPADPRPISRAQFAERVIAKAESVTTNLGGSSR
jgi:hypothetical protein